jgi:uridine kinase
MDMMIFVDTDDDIRLGRRSKQLIILVYRDIKDRGRNVARVLERYMKFVKPAFDEYIKPVTIFDPRQEEWRISLFQEAWRTMLQSKL